MQSEKLLLDSVLEDFNNQRIDEAFEKLDEYMKNTPIKYVGEDGVEYYYFENELERTLFEEYIKTDKTIKLIPDDEPIVDLHYLYAYLLVEKDRLTEAEEHLKIALNYNPVSVSVIQELIDLYKRQSKWDNMGEYIKLSFRYAYTPSSLARTYRLLGFYYTEIHRYNLAVALYLYSLKYEDNQSAYHELGYLEHLGQNTNLTKEDVINILNEENIHLVANEFIVKHYRNMGDNYVENNDYENALHIYTLAYALDDSLENQMRCKMTEAVINGDTNVNIFL